MRRERGTGDEAGSVATIDRRRTMREAVVRYGRRLLTPGARTDPDAVLRLIAWIAGISIAAVLALSAVTVYEITAGEATRDAREAAARVSRAMFEEQRDRLAPRGSDGRYRIQPNQADLPVIDRYFRTYLSNFDILKVKVYTPAGKIVYSTDRKIIGHTDADNRRLARALTGAVDSHTEKKDRMLDLRDETKFNIAVVETYIPIRAGNEVIGVFELYTDVTPYSRAIVHIVTLTVACLAGILLSVLVCACLVIRRGTGILKDTQQELAHKVLLLEEALANVKHLEGIIPICMYCKKIRDDKASWQQLEQYISNHSEARFSHGICPECYEKQLQEIKDGLG
ncbi:hypothetical protein F6V30_09145 [Oryzomonas sagensis]|uniref:Uncharacterized protein n=1 Tax=Oryzomonas sagensis TaxID=2603857 RepID=A0ABQ6TNU4_9BACT|nr:hypothetical protein [Oryzomonas sagensis]KAB0670309.1 hypothetical protein F6V30_09145 [Oryzomonas sagensis]